MAGRRALTLLIALALFCSTRAARANGRFPQAQVVLAAPGSDGTKLTMRATFGILVSRDAGRTWSWVCERALGYEGQWDPPIALTRDGTLYVGLARGVASTADDGCTVASAPEIAGETIKDLTTDGRGETVWAIAGRAGDRSSVWKKPKGKPWERLPAKGLEELNLLTIEVASRGQAPDRVYVSGEPYDTIRGRLYRSDDGARTFDGAANEQQPDGPFFIAAVDPKDPARVLVRHLHGEGSELLLTTDAGRTFTNVLSMKSAMFGFAKAPDGVTYWAGSGLDRDGIYRSTDRGAHFERVANHGVLCLDAAGERLFACENAMTPGAPVLAGSTDQGKTLTPLSRFADVTGPVACRAADAGAALCGPAWPEMQALLAPSAPPAEADAAAPTADAGEADAGRAPQAPPRRSSCGCHAVGRADLDLRWPTSGLLPLALWARHRRRRGSARTHAGHS